MELLVVIAIIILVSAVTLPVVLPAIAHREVSEAARILQGGLAGARDSAIHNNAPSGIRLLPDPAFPIHWLDPNNPSDQAFVSQYPATLGFYQIDPRSVLAANRYVPLETPPDYHTGQVQVYPTGIYTSLPYLPSGTQVLIVEQSPFAGNGLPNEPTSWFWNARVGDKIQIGGTDNVYTVVGPMEVGPGPNTQLGNNGGNSELFVNATSYPSRLGPNNSHITLSWDYLYVVNGRDDDGNGVVDDGWDHNSTYYEQERWLGQFSQLSTGGVRDLAYNIRRRPAPVSGGREIALPTNVVVDLTTWNTHVYGAERSRLIVNPYSGAVDILVYPDGTVVPTTIYSSPASFGMGAASFQFWLAERQDVVPPSSTASSAPHLPVGLIDLSLAGVPYGGPALKGEYCLVTLSARTGRLATNRNPPFDNPASPANGAYNPSYPFLEAQRGVNGGP